jgi:hypothetical protein
MCQKLILNQLLRVVSLKYFLNIFPILLVCFTVSTFLSEKIKIHAERDFVDFFDIIFFFFFNQFRFLWATAQCGQTELVPTCPH